MHDVERDSSPPTSNCESLIQGCKAAAVVLVNMLVTVFKAAGAGWGISHNKAVGKNDSSL